MANSVATIPDPTDFGNKPGDGPLRPGGVPGQPDAEASKPSTKSPQAARQAGPLTLVRDVCGGTDVLRAKAQTYLPQSPGEAGPHYTNRLNRSVFFNAFKRTAEGLTGLVFRKDIVLGEDVPEVMRGHWENIDNAGTHGDVFCRDLFQDDLVAGHAAVLVEFPATDGSQNADVEMAGEIRPYWVPIKKDNIVSWRTAVVDGRTVLQQVVLKECIYEPVGEFGSQEVTRYRVLFLTGIAGAEVGWKLLREVDGNVIVEGGGIYGNQVEIPLAEVTSAGRVSIFESDPPLKDLAYLNVAHYQMWSDYNWSIHKTCVPFIFGAGITEATDSAGNKVPLKVGANTAVLMPNADADLKYVSHSGESLDKVEQALENLKSDMGSLGLAMLAPQKRAAETAEAKRLDKATSDSALAVTARGLQDGIERALGFHARYLKLESGGSVEVNRDFEGLLMDAPVMQAFAQLYNAGFPARPILEALQGGGRIGPDVDIDELELQMIAGTMAKEAEQQQAIEDNLEGVSA